MGKKIVRGLRRFWAGVCFLGTFVYIIMLLTDNAPTTVESRPMLIFLAVFFAVIGFLLWPKKKKQKATPAPVVTPDDISAARTALRDANRTLDDMMRSGNIASVTTEIIPDALPDHVYADMRATYTAVQAQNDSRIIEDCLRLMETTEDLDTFYSRYELGMRHALTIQQAETVGIQTGVRGDPVQVVTDKKAAQSGPALIRSYEKMRNGAEQLKSASGKKGRYIKYLELLHRYAHEYEFEDKETYDQIKAEITKYLVK